MTTESTPELAQLDPIEARIIGSLIEKEATTPEQYPLSLNALVNGCNQKNNRDPLLSLSEREVNDAILKLRVAGLVEFVQLAGQRVEKYRHKTGSALHLEPAEVVFRILLFKLFNKIETWQLLEEELGSISASEFSVDKVGAILKRALEQGHHIYSGAYIMPAGTKTFNTVRKHEAHLQLLEFMLRDGLAEKIQAAESLKEVFQILRSYPLIGDFLAFQYAIDINYSEVTDFAESQFVAAGPGARSGLRKCFANLDGVAAEDVIRLVTELQEEEFKRRHIAFPWLGGRRMQLIDVQNVFCEIDKYARVRFPEAVGLANRAKIKQRFKPNPAPVSQWYPPKWGINESI